MTKAYATPDLQSDEIHVVRMIEDLREQARPRLADPRRWVGGLRRMSFARAVQASNSIEGYDASLDDVVAVVEGERPLDASEDTRLAVAGYRDAMTYVLQLAQDAAVPVDINLVKSLHFMMIKHDLSKNPGRWRPGAVYVRREPSGEIVYTGPEADLVPELILAMLEQLETDTEPALVRAAMAHLNLVMIHPFSDGNGRMGRCLQTLVLAGERILAPAFSSIEEYVGHNTPAYYDVLAEVGQGSWNPHHDARPWLRFSLTAHYHQAKTFLRRIREAEQVWNACAELAGSHKLPERSISALWDAAIGFRIRNSTYRAAIKYSFDEEISDLTASRDLKALVDRGLLTAIGERRGRHYVGTKLVKDEWESIRANRPPRDESDPFETAAKLPPEEQLALSDPGGEGKQQG